MKNHRPPQAKLERVENGVAEGTPDVHSIARAVTVWFELKALRRPKRVKTRFFPKKKLRVPQMAWHAEYAARGGRSFVLVRDHLYQLYLIPGGQLHLVKDMSTEEAMRRFAIADWGTLFNLAFRLDR
jgi:hypothetical protein